MQLTGVLAPENIAVGVKLKSKKRVLELLSQLMSVGHAELNPQQLFAALMERERLGTTVIGNGVAVPHGRIHDLTHPVGGFVRLKRPISFDADDQQPVDLVFSLLVPESATPEHLALLSNIALFFNNPAQCLAVRSATESPHILNLLSLTN